MPERLWTPRRRGSGCQRRGSVRSVDHNWSGPDSTRTRTARPCSTTSARHVDKPRPGRWS